MVDGLKSILEGNDRYEVTATCSSGAETLERLKVEPIDIAVLDIEMGNPTGIEITEWLSENKPETKVLILSMHKTESYIADVLALGASGYILKHLGEDELIDALDTVVNGDRFFSQEIRDMMFQVFSRQARREKQGGKLNITKRERDIIGELVKGKTSQQVADTLYIQKSTVESHKKNLYSKTKTKTLSALMVWASKNEDLWKI